MTIGQSACLLFLAFFFLHFLENFIFFIFRKESNFRSRTGHRQYLPGLCINCRCCYDSNRLVSVPQRIKIAITPAKDLAAAAPPGGLTNGVSGSESGHTIKLSVGGIPPGSTAV